VISALAGAGCEKKSDSGSSAHTDHSHSTADHGHDHAPGETHDRGTATAGGEAGGEAHDANDGHDHGQSHGHGPATDLGHQVAGAFTVSSARTSDVIGGSDATFDVSVTGPTVPVAVRIWVGTQDAKGSVKSLCPMEDGVGHAHADVPNPLPQDSRLWVELEVQGGEKVLVGFELRM